MADHQFEKKISRKMDGFELKPSADVWEQVEAQLREDRKRRRWFFLLLPVGLLLICGLTYSLWPSEKRTAASNTPNNNNQVAQKESTESATQSKPQQKVQPAISKMKKPGTETSTQNEITPSGQANIQTQLPVLVERRKPVARKLNKPALAHNKQNQSTDNTIAEKKTAVIVETQTSRIGEEENAEIVGGSQSVVAEKEQKEDAVVMVEQPSPADSIHTGEALTLTDTVSPIAASKPSVVQTPRKLQWGAHTNVGIADIRETFFPGTGFRAESTSYFGNTSSQGAPINGASRIVVYEYAIQPSLQFGVGAVLRKKFANKHAFVTGLFYQYNSYAVTQRERIDTFVAANNLFTNVSTKDVKASFRIHTLSVPLEWEFQLANAGKGSFRLGAGVHNWFSFSSTQTKSLSAFRYDRTASGVAASPQPSVTTYQPVLHLAPMYEWSRGKQTFQAGLFFNYGLRPVYQSSAKDYWWQTGVRFRIYFNK